MTEPRYIIERDNAHGQWAVVAERFWAKVDRPSPDGCWVWTAATNNHGYGSFRVPADEARPRRTVGAHTWAWTDANGPVPPGLELDHLCRNRLCVNPSHLEPVTHAENIRRGKWGTTNTSKTHCPKGHPYEGDNLYWSERTGRLCRTCQAEHVRAYKARKKAARA